jgi:hypothetical protein
VKQDSSRRLFLAAGLGAPAALASTSAAKQPKLEHRKLGKTGLKVTSVAFGSMITSDGTVLERAADLGINYFDTARGYQNGNCERMVGAALKSKRKSLYISTKSGSKSKEGLLSDLDKSLQEMTTDYVDIWYLHGIGKPETVTEGMLEAQQMAKKAGKARFLGLSVHSGHEKVIPYAVEHKDHFDVVLTSYNFAMEAQMNQLITDAHKAGIGIVAMKVMAGGNRRMSRPDADPKVKAILGKEGAMLSALKWVLKNKDVDTTIPSITDMDQLEDDLKAMSEPYSGGDAKILEARLEELRPWYCRMCGKCEGSCVKGLPVEDMLRYAMYAESYGQFGLGREHFRVLPPEVAEVRCGDCRECTVSCPHGVQVARRLSWCQECLA